ncbi:fimbrial protein [Proteus mirabilis]|uniref:fimbrial protein n=1 Tax=Proteus mirabilis TaxID=584 RepID=UPI000CEBAECF|nr:fimbrial protein [Proteus mirabilis]ELA7862969.1 type 1 fimbrial protein [Proteus mirabilis]MBB6725108.1 type 1 fimbrial protein [Proteus mirabilis]MCL8589109.1 type 1 fimbrial protein [Proteus mirabilis]MCL8596041.1 type 1 fimbrial protein [Proteus mirabilis]MCT8196315.1 type 1 fimbrial protein [Proteus mirabilis]
MHKLMLIVALSLLFTTKGSAYDTLVHINARVTGNTCTVETNSKRITVKLGQIATKDFISTTITQQRTPVIPFSIKLVDCQPEASAVKVSFNGRTDPIDNALLAIDATGAKGVAISIMDNSGASIDINDKSQSYTLLPNQDNTLQFYARYVATQLPVQAGSANATATFLLEYQ